MFTSTDLMHLVFADETDTYYLKGLFQLDFKRTLWFLLRERQFDSVYFLTFREDGCRAFCYGSRDAEDILPEPPKKKRFPAARDTADTVGEWLERQLQGDAGRRAAVVCSLSAFCGWFEAQSRGDVLARLAQMEARTGILVLTAPPAAKETRDLLLRSPVFDRLGETWQPALRSKSARGLCGAVSEILGERCVCLHLYTEARLMQITRYLLLTDPKKCYDFTDASLPAAYLFQYMNSEAFRAAEEAEGVLLPPNTAPFRALAERLREPGVWKTAARRIKVMEAVGGLRAYCGAHGIALTDAPYITAEDQTAEAPAAERPALEEDAAFAFDPAALEDAVGGFDPPDVSDGGFAEAAAGPVAPAPEDGVDVKEVPWEDEAEVLWENETEVPLEAGVVPEAEDAAQDDGETADGFSFVFPE